LPSRKLGAVELRGIRLLVGEQRPQGHLVAAVHELRVSVPARHLVRTIVRQRDVARLDQEVALGRHAAAFPHRRGSGIRVDCELEAARDADADQVGPRQALLLVEIFDDRVQMLVGEHLIGVEDRVCVDCCLHGVLSAFAFGGAWRMAASDRVRFPRQDRRARSRRSRASRAPCGSSAQGSRRCPRRNRAEWPRDRCCSASRASARAAPIGRRLRDRTRSSCPGTRRPLHRCPPRRSLRHRARAAAA